MALTVYVTVLFPTTFIVACSYTERQDRGRRVRFTLTDGDGRETGEMGRDRPPSLLVTHESVLDERSGGTGTRNFSRLPDHEPLLSWDGGEIRHI